MSADDDHGLSGTVLDEALELTLSEICSVCGVHAELVIEMVEEGVIQPEGGVPEQWRFSGRTVIRAQKALRLARDLRVNWPGAALALDLIEELERMREAARRPAGRRR